jgi:hypothetical protein
MLHLVRTANLVLFLHAVLIKSFWPGVHYYLHTKNNSIIFYVKYLALYYHVNIS